MDIQIRKEEEKDYKRVEEVARDAFWNLYIPGAYEHYVINRMREHKDFIKELSFVIEVDGKVEGAIFYTHSKIIKEDETEYKTISFGPVFISPEYHRKGLGKKLITHSIEEAKRLGHTVITTLGYPYHYKPYGFLGGKKYKISMPDMKYYIGLLVLPLYESALDNVSGHVEFSECLEGLEVTSEKIDEFDKQFPYKEKKIEKSQEEYEKASVQLDESEY